MNLIRVHQQLATEGDALNYLVKSRWPGGVCCIAVQPRQGLRHFHRRKDGEAVRPIRVRQVRPPVPPKCLLSWEKDGGTDLNYRIAARW
jgi:hypothetical protein